MEAKLWRLTVLIAVLSFTICGAYAGYSWYQEVRLSQDVKSGIKLLRQLQSKCESPDTPPYGTFGKETICFTAQGRENYVRAVSEERFGYRDTKETFFIAATLIPTITFLIFFLGRWVATGSIRKKAQA